MLIIPTDPTDAAHHGLTVPVTTQPTEGELGCTPQLAERLLACWPWATETTDAQGIRWLHLPPLTHRPEEATA